LSGRPGFIQRDPEIERAREDMHGKAREDMHGKLDTLKHTTTLDGATVIALLLVQRAWELNERLVVVTLGAVGVSFVLALMGYMGVSSWLGSSESELRHYTFGRYYWITFLSISLLIVGVFLFLFNVFVAPSLPAE